MSTGKSLFNDTSLLHFMTSSAFVSLQNIPTTDRNELMRLFTREVLHVLGFSAKLFPRQVHFYL